MGSSHSITCNTWVVLKCICPAIGCGNDLETTWEHVGCGGVVEINSQALLRCSKNCGICTMIDGCWSCAKHLGDYRKGDQKSMLHALTIAASLRPTSDKEWFKRIIKSAMALS
jgi:hypothetical protein